MTGQPHRSCADQDWVESMFADLQRQIDDLSGQLQALTNLVHIHTVAALTEPRSNTRPMSERPREAGDG